MLAHDVTLDRAHKYKTLKVNPFIRQQLVERIKYFDCMVLLGIISLCNHGDTLWKEKMSLMCIYTLHKEM